MTMRRKIIGLLALATAAFLPETAHAGWVVISDASVLKPYVHLTQQKVYVPGLSTENPAWTQTTTTAYYIEASQLI